MKIIATSPSFSNNRKLKEELSRLSPDVKFNTQGLRFSEQELIEFIGDAEGAIIGTENITEKVLLSCPKLRFIGKYGVGMDNIDTNACEKHNVGIGWTGGINKTSVAEMTLSFMLGLCRNLYKTSYQLKNGLWNKDGGFQLSGKTVGIIGLGNIGKEVACMLKPFGCRILANDILDQREYCRVEGLEQVEREFLLAESDIVTLHIPLEGGMARFFNLLHFEKMKNTAFLINTARGPLVIQEDLEKALKSGMIAGAALDVYEDEPVSDPEFIKLPNLICTPHIGGSAEESILAMGRSAIAWLEKFNSQKL